MLITVIIASKNRPEQLRACLAAIEKSAYRNFEVVIVSQGSQLISQSTIKSLHLPHVTHLLCKRAGKSAAINTAIDVAQGEVLAFTDDDCLVASTWLGHIARGFAKYPHIHAIFGKTMPHKPEQHKKQISPSVFLKQNRTIITTPRAHYLHIGFGNNMSVRTSAVKEIGGFKEWLGPGSLGSNAEDANAALSLLMRRKSILYDPAVAVFHNRWLTPAQMSTQALSYICGEMACYGYFFFLGHSFARPVVRRAISRFGYNIRAKIIRGSRHISVLYEIRYALSLMRGLCIGWYFAQHDSATTEKKK